MLKKQNNNKKPCIVDSFKSLGKDLKLCFKQNMPLILSFLLVHCIKTLPLYSYTDGFCRYRIMSIMNVYSLYNTQWQLQYFGKQLRLKFMVDSLGLLPSSVWQDMDQVCIILLLLLFTPFFIRGNRRWLFEGGGAAVPCNSSASLADWGMNIRSVLQTLL